jgi:isoquinoline 1-oxidoreductase subunit alpha
MSLAYKRMRNFPTNQLPLRLLPSSLGEQHSQSIHISTSAGFLMLTLNINGKAMQVDAEPDTPLLWVLRDTLQLTGTKFGCGAALCGACTVHLDGQPVRSCSTPLSAAAGKKIVTIEGVGDGRVGKAVQQAWQKLDVVQCGYCQSGQIMSAVALLEKNHKPTDADIDGAMGGNICRCGTYVRIRAGIHEAAKSLA